MCVLLLVRVCVAHLTMTFEVNLNGDVVNLNVISAAVAVSYENESGRAHRLLLFLPGQVCPLFTTRPWRCSPTITAPSLTGRWWTTAGPSPLQYLYPLPQQLPRLTLRWTRDVTWFAWPLSTTTSTSLTEGQQKDNDFNGRGAVFYFILILSEEECYCRCVLNEIEFHWGLVINAGSLALPCWRRWCIRICTRLCVFASPQTKPWMLTWLQLVLVSSCSLQKRKKTKYALLLLKPIWAWKIQQVTESVQVLFLSLNQFGMWQDPLCHVRARLFVLLMGGEEWQKAFGLKQCLVLLWIIWLMAAVKTTAFTHDKKHCNVPFFILAYCPFMTKPCDMYIVTCRCISNDHINWSANLHIGPIVAYRPTCNS